ncbi:tetraspanin-2 isoform X1 [Arapaima gigas]
MSKVQGGMKCVKYLLFVFNFIFWLVGSLVLAVGLWLRFDPDTTSLLSENGAPGTFFIGEYKNRKQLDHAYLQVQLNCSSRSAFFACLTSSLFFFTCLLVIFGAEVAAGVFGFLNKDKIIEEVQSFYSEAVDENTNNTVAIVYHKILNCCRSSTSNASMCPESGTELKNCEDAIADFFNSKLYIIGYVGIGIAGIMIIGMIFSMVLCCAIRNNRELI